MRRAAALPTALLLLAGCAPPAGTESRVGPDTSAVRHDDGTVVLVPAADPRGGADALVSGSLVRLDGGCLGLRTGADGADGADGAGAVTVLVRWPYGTRWDPDRQELSVARLQPAGERGAVRLGDAVSLGGGTWGSPPASLGCSADGTWSAS